MSFSNILLDIWMYANTCCFGIVIKTLSPHSLPFKWNVEALNSFGTNNKQTKRRRNFARKKVWFEGQLQSKLYVCVLCMCVCPIIRLWSQFSPQRTDECELTYSAKLLTSLRLPSYPSFYPISKYSIKIANTHSILKTYK